MKIYPIVLALFCTPLFAQDFSAIEQLANCSDPKELSKLSHTLALAAIGDTDAVKHYDIAHAAAQRCAEDALKSAMTESAISAELKAAVKDLYVKGNALIAKAGQPADPALMRERDEAWQRVRMEMKLAQK